MISVIILAGGTGTRMQSNVPKQFIELNGKLVIRHSLDIFLSLPEITEIIIVCDQQYHHMFENVKFALPGKRRQDSVYNGLLQATGDFVCIHDAARPCITQQNVRDVIDAAKTFGAATLGMPIKFTVKESDSKEFVSRTLDRSTLWEIQTPQVIRCDWLKEGFNKLNSDVTDDVAIVELLGYPVKLVRGSYSNIKITTPEDLRNVAKI